MSSADDYYEAITVELGRQSGRLRAPSPLPAGADWAGVSMTTRFDLSDIGASVADFEQATGRGPKGS